MTNESENILDDLHFEYLSKLLMLNTAIWSTLLTLHAITISVLALALSLLVKKLNISIILITVVILALAFIAIYLLLKNFTDCREVYDKLCYHTHRNNRDYESLKAEKNNAEAKNELRKRRERFAKNAFYVEFIAIFALFFTN